MCVLMAQMTNSIIDRGKSSPRLKNTQTGRPANTDLCPQVCSYIALQPVKVYLTLSMAIAIPAGGTGTPGPGLYAN